MPESDSESDKEYVPPAGDPKSSSSDEEDEPESKRARLTSPNPSGEGETSKKLAREDAWKSFQDSVTTNSSVSHADEAPKKLIKIERRYLFAGEEVVEVVEVSEDSVDAKKWPRWSPPDESKSAVSYLSAVHGPPSEPSGSNAAPIQMPVTEPHVPTLTPVQTKRPGPRRSKTTLASLPSSSKPKKITILEKSAMDWRSHVGSQPESELKDELEANRRGGGYLEKVEFLERVHERKEDVLEKSKGAKRRR